MRKWRESTCLSCLAGIQYIACFCMQVVLLCSCTCTILIEVCVNLCYFLEEEESPSWFTRNWDVSLLFLLLTMEEAGTFLLKSNFLTIWCHLYTYPQYIACCMFIWNILKIYITSTSLQLQTWAEWGWDWHWPHPASSSSFFPFRKHLKYLFSTSTMK